MIAAVLAAYGLVAAYVGMGLPFGGAGMIGQSVSGAIILGYVLCVPFGLAFAVLGSPFLLVWRSIVRPQAPYVRPGYLVVALYGPVLLALAGVANFLMAVAIYEFIAYFATVLFVRMCRSLEMF